MHTKALSVRMLAMLAVLSLVFAACEAETAGPEQGVTAEDLQALEDRIGQLEQEVGQLDEGDLEDGELQRDVSEILGSQVTISGEVSAELPENEMAFRIGGDFWTFDEGVLVVSATNEPFEAGISEGELVQVTGTVEQFVIADIEDEYGIDLDDDLFVDFEGQMLSSPSRATWTGWFPRTRPARTALSPSFPTSAVGCQQSAVSFQPVGLCPPAVKAGGRGPTAV